MGKKKATLFQAENSIFICAQYIVMINNIWSDNFLIIHNLLCSWDQFFVHSLIQSSSTTGHSTVLIILLLAELHWT
jgi:hypothetical protein